MFECKPWRGPLTRLLHMSADEVLTRGKQAIAKRLDLAICRLGMDLSADSVDRSDVTQGHFFFSNEELPQILLLLQQRLPDQAREIVAQADQIMAHRFTLLGYQNLDCGPEIDWHLDAVHGKRAPRKPWFKIRLLEFKEVGDSKVTAELNRHQHLVTLAKAYQLTTEDRFAAEAVRQWSDWQRDNPYPMGINWASSLEVAFRSLSWLWLRHLLAGAQVMPPRFQTDLLHGLEISGRHIERYLSTYFSPNTHLLGEGVALFFIGTLCPELPAAKRWKQLGWQIVLREAERQVQPDGMHFEQSVYYHVYALDFFLHSRILAARNDVPIPPAFDQTVERMLEALSLLAQAGPVPSLGDDDGGRVFNPRRNQPEHMTDPLSTGAILFNRADFKSSAGPLIEEAVWLLGREGAAQFERLSTSERLVASRRLESSGICVMAGSGRRSEKMVIDAGPLGHGTAGHGHADALSVALTINGKQWLVDPGTCCYISEGKDREKFRGTAAHNTLQVDGLDQAEPSSPFAWRMAPQVGVDRWVAGRTFDFFSGRHNGYRRLQEPVIHQRRVLYLKQKFWLVQDRALGDGEHQLALHWHMAPGNDHIVPSSEDFVLQGEGAQGLAFLLPKDHLWQQEIMRGEVSAVYGRSEPGLVLRLSTAALLPAEIATLVLPLEVSASEALQLGEFTFLRPGKDDESASGYLFERLGERHSIFFAGRLQCWTMDPWESDAQLMYCGASEDDGLHLILCGGSYLKWNGKPILTCDVQLDRWELLAGKSGEEEFCSDEAVQRKVNVNSLLGLEYCRDK